MRYMRWLLLVAIVYAMTPSLRAQLSPFADLSEGYLVPCSLDYFDIANASLYPPCWELWNTYQTPYQAYYSQSYRRRSLGGRHYLSVGATRVAVHREGLKALDGMRLENGYKVGHGGKVEVPGAGYVRPVVDRSTGRLTLPASAIARSTAYSGNAGAGNSGAGNAGARGAATGPVARSGAVAGNSGMGMAHGASSGGASGGARH